MRTSRQILLLLIILLHCCPKDSFAQNLLLEIETDPPITNSIYQSLQIPKNFSDRESLQKKTDTIHKIFMQYGFIDSVLDTLQKKNDSTYLARFNLGQQYEKIKIYYDSKTFSIRELKTISTEVTEDYFILPTSSTPETLFHLTQTLSNKGNPFVRLRLNEIQKSEEGNLTARLITSKEQIRTIDSIVIKGYEKFPAAYLKYYAEIRKGNIFNRKKLLTQSEKINSLGFASTTSPPEALFRKDSTAVFLYLKKENNNLFDGILGFATDEITQKLIFNGYLNLELNNNLDYGEKFLLNYRADGHKQVEFKTRLDLPFLFQTRFGTSAELKIFKRDTSYVTTEQKIRLTHQYTSKLRSYLGYQRQISSNLLDQTIGDLPIESYNSKFFIFGVHFAQMQNNKIFPTKTFFSGDFGVGNRERAAQSSRQWKIELNLNHIFNLNFRHSIYINNQSAFLLSENYLTNELFRFGGINSIRGFEENSIDASAFSILRTEYRYLLSENLFIHSIIDAGYFDNDILEMNSTLYSLGIGLGIYTKTGLFRFIIANGRTVQQDFDFSATKAHISITAKF